VLTSPQTILSARNNLSPLLSLGRVAPVTNTQIRALAAHASSHHEEAKPDFKEAFSFDATKWALALLGCVAVGVAFAANMSNNEIVSLLFKKRRRRRRRRRTQ